MTIKRLEVTESLGDVDFGDLALRYTALKDLYKDLENLFTKRLELHDLKIVNGEFPPGISISLSASYDGMEVSVYRTRLENGKEYEDRMRKQKKFAQHKQNLKEATESVERRQLATLIEKYGVPK